MFRIAVLATVAIAILSAFLTAGSILWYDMLFEAQYVALAVIALNSKDTRRDRAVIMVLLAWGIWILATDWPPFNFPPIYLNFEAAAFSALTLWALFRPYNYVSDKLNKDDVFIGFYQGRNKHPLSVLSSLIGLPFSSIAMIAGDVTIRSSGGVLKEVPTASLSPEHYVFINTTTPATDKIIADLRALSGASATVYGLRVGCIWAMRKALAAVGYRLSWRDYIPSLFYRTALEERGGKNAN